MEQLSREEMIAQIIIWNGSSAESYKNVSDKRVKELFDDVFNQRTEEQR